MNIIEGTFKGIQRRLYYTDTQKAIDAFDKFKAEMADGDAIRLIVDHIVLARAIK